MATRFHHAQGVLIAALALALAGCGEKDGNNLATLDAELTNNTVDPALREAVEGPLATDPDLRGEANRDAVRPSDRPLTGAVPANLSPTDARREALRLAGGRLMRTPSATKEVTSTKEPVTLGGLAEQKQGKGACADARIGYDMGWAARMPAAFPVYPGGRVTEAAGSDRSPCGLRAASFTTPVAPDEAMDFYYTMARRAGYSAEHVEQNGAHVLGGTRARDDGAFYVSFSALRGGGTAVDLIATGGR